MMRFRQFGVIGWMILAWVLWVTGAQAAPAGKDVTDGMNIPDVVAKINGVDLKSDYIKLRMNLEARQAPRELTLNEKLKLAQDIIEKEVARELIYQAGKAEAEAIPPERIQQELDNLKKNYPNETEFQKALDVRKISELDLMKTIETDMMAEQLLSRQVKGKVEIGDDKVQEFYDRNLKRFFRPESFRAQHIFVPFVPLKAVQNTPREELESKLEQYNKEAEASIQSIMKEVQAGKDFGELAKKHSQDVATASKGGDLDFIYKGVFDPAFDEAVGKLKVGETSDVVKTQFGYHIIKLNEKRPSDHAPFEEVRGEIQKFLFMREAQKLVGEYIDTLRKKAKVEIFY